MMSIAEVFDNKAFFASMGAEKPDAKAIVEMLPFTNATGFRVFVTSQDECSEWMLPQDLTEQVYHFIRATVCYEAHQFAMSALTNEVYPTLQENFEPTTNDEEVRYE
jgi:hypothetical protein